MVNTKKKEERKNETKRDRTQRRKYVELKSVYIYIYVHSLFPFAYNVP
jgi:hypothetical protein